MDKKTKRTFQIPEWIVKAVAILAISFNVSLIVCIVILVVLSVTTTINIPLNTNQDEQQTDRNIERNDLNITPALTKITEEPTEQRSEIPDFEKIQAENFSTRVEEKKVLDILEGENDLSYSYKHYYLYCAPENFDPRDYRFEVSSDKTYAISKKDNSKWTSSIQIKSESFSKNVSITQYTFTCDGDIVPASGGIGYSTIKEILRNNNRVALYTDFGNPLNGKSEISTLNNELILISDLEQGFQPVILNTSTGNKFLLGWSDCIGFDAWWDGNSLLTVARNSNELSAPNSDGIYKSTICLWDSNGKLIRKFSTDLSYVIGLQVGLPLSSQFGIIDKNFVYTFTEYGSYSDNKECILLVQDMRDEENALVYKINVTEPGISLSKCDGVSFSFEFEAGNISLIHYFTNRVIKVK